MILEVTLLLAEKKNLFVKVPLMQALHLLVNGLEKQWIRQRFADWYAEQIQGGLELGLDLESIEVKSDADFHETTSCRMAD